MSAPEALVRGVTPEAPAPEVSPKENQAPKSQRQSRGGQRQQHKKTAQKPGLLARLWALLFGDDTQDKAKQRQGGRGGKGEQNRRRSRNRSGDRQRDDRSEGDGNRQRNRGGRNDRDNRRNGRNRKPEGDEAANTQQQIAAAGARTLAVIKTASSPSARGADVGVAVASGTMTGRPTTRRKAQPRKTLIAKRPKLWQKTQVSRIDDGQQTNATRDGAEDSVRP